MKNHRAALLSQVQDLFVNDKRELKQVRRIWVLEAQCSFLSHVLQLHMLATVLALVLLEGVTKSDCCFADSARRTASARVP